GRPQRAPGVLRTVPARLRAQRHSSFRSVGCVKQLTQDSVRCVKQLSRRVAVTKPWRTFVMISIGVFASLLDLFIVNIAFPDIQRDFAGSGLAELSWVLNGYAVVFAALLVPSGRLADLYGRKRGF